MKIRNLWESILLILSATAIVAYLLVTESPASINPVAEVKALDMGYEWFTAGRSKMLNPGQQLNNAVYIDLNLSFINDIIYLDNKIFSLTDQSQFRTISWSYELGINLFDSADVYYRHFSGHLLDTNYSDGSSYPFENSVGVRFHLLRN